MTKKNAKEVDSDKNNAQAKIEEIIKENHLQGNVFYTSVLPDGSVCVVDLRGKKYYGTP